MKIVLTRPASYKDSELHELELDFDSLTGNDLIQAEANLKRSQPDAPLWGTQHMAAIAAKASHIPAEFISGLPAKDFLAITAAVLGFFSATDFTASQLQTTES